MTNARNMLVRDPELRDALELKIVLKSEPIQPIQINQEPLVDVCSLVVTH